MLPGNASEERKRILKAYGAETVFSDPDESSDGAIRMVRQIYMEDPDRYFYPDQYNNPANWKAHFEGTGAEIIHQTTARITHFVAAMGTSGTFTGVTRRLRRDLPEVKCYSAQPSSGFHGLEGLKHMPTAIRARLLRRHAGRWQPLDRDRGRLPHGAPAGPRRGSAGRHFLRLQRARRYPARPRNRCPRASPAIIVTVLCDSAEKYLSEHFWDEE